MIVMASALTEIITFSDPALVHARSGDRIWWQLPSTGKAFCLKLFDQCLSPVATNPKDLKSQGRYLKPTRTAWDLQFSMNDIVCAGEKCRGLSPAQMIQMFKSGLQTAEVNSIGIYHYKIPQAVHTLPTSTIIVESGERVSLLDFSPFCERPLVNGSPLIAWSTISDEHVQ